MLVQASKQHHNIEHKHSKPKIPRLNTTTGKTTKASDVSYGIFGANTGTDRLLEFFDQLYNLISSLSSA